MHQGTDTSFGDTVYFYHANCCFAERLWEVLLWPC